MTPVSVGSCSLFAVPSMPPENPKCDVLGSTSIYVTWSPPHKDGQNGKIRGYKVAYTAAEDFHEKAPMMATTTNQYFTIENAHKYTNYTITVLAFTSVGDGIRTKNFHCITHEDGERFHFPIEKRQQNFFPTN